MSATGLKLFTFLFPVHVIPHRLIPGRAFAAHFFEKGLLLRVVQRFFYFCNGLLKTQTLLALGVTAPGITHVGHAGYDRTIAIFLEDQVAQPAANAQDIVFQYHMLYYFDVTTFYANYQRFRCPLYTLNIGIGNEG